MTGYTPKVGHRVRITDVIEGVVIDAADSWFEITRDSNSLGYIYNTEAEPGRTIEHLPDPEPEWQPGDVVAVEYPGSTEVYALTPDGWRNLGVRGGRPFDTFFVGRLTWRLLVRGGQVQP